MQLGRNSRGEDEEGEQYLIPLYLRPSSGCVRSPVSLSSLRIWIRHEWQHSIMLLLVG